MNFLRPPSLLLQDGNQLCRISLPALANFVGIPEPALLHALRAASAAASGQGVDKLPAKDDEPSGDVGEGTIGEGKRFDVHTNVETKYFETERCRPATVDKLQPSEQAFVEELALTLQDGANLGALKVLATKNPRWLLEEALRRTMAIPATRIRKSRGACFTAIVRILTMEHGHQKPRRPGDDVPM